MPGVLDHLQPVRLFQIWEYFSLYYISIDDMSTFSMLAKQQMTLSAWHIYPLNYDEFLSIDQRCT